MAQQTFRGSCLCGGVKYELTGTPGYFYHCHCRRCRKANGSAHASNIRVKPDTFRWLTGEDLLQRYKLPEAERFYTLFCSRCGSPMPRDVPELEAVIIPAGSLDHDINLKPQARIFWASRASWSCENDGIKTFVGYPE